MISVIIPLYNKKDFILDTIKSVFNQTFNDYELIVVNDGSTDGSEKLVESLKDDRIRLFTKKNEGVSKARNYGVQKSNYDYVTFLDADDLWNDFFLETVWDLKTKYPGAKIFSTNFTIQEGDGKERLASNNISEGYIKDYFKYSLSNYMIHSSSVMISKQAFINSGGFDSRLTRGEDLQLWAKIVKENTYAYSPKSCSSYVIRVNNSSLLHVPKPNKSFAYHINLDDCNSKYEYNYYRKIIVRKMFSYLLKSGRVDYFFKLLIKYNFKLIFTKIK